MKTQRHFRDKLNRGAQHLRGMIRRLTVKATGELFRWAVLGYIDADDNEEGDDAELFQQVGFASRPPAGANAEVIVVNVGASPNTPVIVACRDEDTRRAFFAGANALAEDEAALYNSSAQVRVKADGTVEVDDGAGGAIALAKADHTHGPGSYMDSTPAPITGTSGASSSNTTVLKGK